MSIKETLKSRGTVYGTYRSGSQFREVVIQELRNRYRQTNGQELPIKYEVMLWDLVNKLSRLAVSPDHIDTVHDIIGYATLYEEVLKEDENANK